MSARPDPVLTAITDDLVRELSALRFSPPVTCVYDPLIYARRGWDAYLARYAQGYKRVVLLGMNPGPWGMAQTGVPFGEVDLVRGWLGIEVPIDRPACEHPARPITGFACPRHEVSGARLWGFLRQRFGTPEAFFREHLVLNWCPLIFLEDSGRNRTPDKLPKDERVALEAVCDRALRRQIEHLRPEVVVGIGRFAQLRAGRALAGLGLDLRCLPHPSPASPAANRGWSELAGACFDALDGGGASVR